MDNLGSRVIRSYRPGRWFGIFGPRVTLVLPPSEKARVGGLWDLVVDGAGFDLTLDTLIGGGLRDLGAFALVATEDDATRVLLRGPVAAVLVADGETVELRGPEGMTWVERSLDGVTRITILTDDESDASEREDEGLAVDEGLVRVSRVDEPRAADEAPAAADESDEPGADESPEAAEVDPDDPADPGPTGLMPLPDRDDVPDVPDAETDADADAETGPERIAPVARLVFSHGESVPVTRSVLVGRSPVADRASDGDPVLIRVSSPQQEVSATHLEIRPGTGADHGSLVAMDLGSTNGTVVAQPGEGPVDLQSGVAVALRVGAEIDLGDGATIRVTDA